ncbi:MAG: Rrf2 family transcriptional regulator [Gemmatimonadota bacterium]
MLSQTAEYALRAVLYLAEQPHGRPVRVDEIGDALGIPANYLSKTLNALVRSRVLASLRGPHGGFRLAVAAEDVSLMQVVAPFDDIAARRHCLLGNPQCSDHQGCAAHHAWKHTSEQVERFFRSTTIADIRRRPSARKSTKNAKPTTTRTRRTA